MKGAEGQKECTLCFNLTPYYITFHIREGYVTSGKKHLGKKQHGLFMIQ